jgi:hypothetical protein
LINTTAFEVNCVKADIPNILSKSDDISAETAEKMLPEWIKKIEKNESNIENNRNKRIEAAKRPPANKYDGIGFIKVGYSTTSLLKELEIEGVKIKEIEPSMTIFSTKVSNLKSYELSNLSVASFVFPGLELTFFNDTLFQIQLDNPSTDFREAMNMKFGQGKIRSEKKKITCRTGLKIEFNEYEETFYTTWKLNNITTTAAETFSIYYDDNCKKKSINYFIMTYLPIQKRAEKLINGADVRKKQVEKEEQKKVLKDF